MHRSVLLLVAVAAAAAHATGLESCGDAQYNPSKYTCYHGSFLCPVYAGEKYKLCGNACYSSFQYSCSGSVLQQLPHEDGPFTLTAWNPTEPDVDGLAVTACGQRLGVGGKTCSFCPITPQSACPAGTSTVLTTSSLEVEVPGGQQLFLDADDFISYTAPHSAYIPAGAHLNSLVAYHGGGLIDIDDAVLGWKACCPTHNGQWTLNSFNATTEHLYPEPSCHSVQLKVLPAPANQFGAWEYT